MMGCSGCNDTGGASYKGHYVNPADWRPTQIRSPYDPPQSLAIYGNDGLALSQALLRTVAKGPLEGIHVQTAKYVMQGGHAQGYSRLNPKDWDNWGCSWPHWAIAYRLLASNSPGPNPQFFPPTQPSSTLPKTQTPIVQHPHVPFYNRKTLD